MLIRLAIALLTVALVAPATAAAQGGGGAPGGGSPRRPAASAPWYRLDVAFTGTIDLTKTTLFYGGSERQVVASSVVMAKGTTTWRFGTKKAVRLRKQPRGRFSFADAVEAEGRIDSSVSNTEVYSGRFTYGEYVEPCASSIIYTYGGAAQASIRSELGGVNVGLEPVEGLRKVPAGMCKWTAAERGVGVHVWDALESKGGIWLVHPSGVGAGFGHTAVTPLDGGFGRRSFTRTVPFKTPLGEVHEDTPSIYSRSDGHVEGKYTIQFTRCRARSTRTC